MPVPSNQVLVYTVSAVRAGRPALRRMTYNDLNDYLDDHPRLQATSKEVPRSAINIDILVKDTYTSAQKERYCDYPNYESNITNIRLGLTYSLSHDYIIIISSNKD